MSNPVIVPCILSGGSGTRLWPASRTKAPKQLQRLISEKTMLVETASRFTTQTDFTPPIIICNRFYVDQVAEQLESAGNPASHILAEPVGRNTAPAAVAVSRLVKEIYQEAQILLLPADHHITDLARFLKAVGDASRAAKHDFIVTFGIRPSHPETGYGYILKDSHKIKETRAHRIRKFVEKPNEELAKTYLNDGGYSWNSGMFLFEPSLFLNEIEQFRPDIRKKTESAIKRSTKDKVNSSKVIFIDQGDFSSCPSDSIDYAVMEKTEKAAVIVDDFGWNDIGSWRALHDIAKKNKDGNHIRGDVICLDTQNSYVRADDRLMALIGVNDLVVVDTPDALMISSLDQVQKVKQIHQQLNKNNRSEAEQHLGQQPSLQNRAIETWKIAEQWLLNKALPLWSSTAINPKDGSSFEVLTYARIAETSTPRRIRVQARQIYSFAYAFDQFGWEPGLPKTQGLLHFLLKNGRNAQSSWGHIFDIDGSFIDDRSDSYDISFILLALAWAYKITHDEKLKKIAIETLSFVQNDLRHSSGLGFNEDTLNTLPRRANPHMHLLEAALNWVELHQIEGFGELADDIVQLYQSHFMIDGLLREYFDENLQLDHAQPTHIPVEPGHLYEWTFLLNEYERIRQKEAPLRAAQEAFADRFGWNPATGLVYDQCNPNGSPVNHPGSRLWPQTEYIRLKLLYGSKEQKLAALEHFHRIYGIYFTFDGEANGLWRDRISQSGEDLSPNSPASSLYHIMGMIGAISRLAKNKSGH